MNQFKYQSYDKWIPNSSYVYYMLTFLEVSLIEFLTAKTLQNLEVFIQV